MNHLSGPCLAQPLPRETPRHGQYLAVIHAYTLVLGRPPGRGDILRVFRVTPPSVHQMLLTLERDDLIRRQRGVAQQSAVGESFRPPTASTSQNPGAQALAGSGAR